MSPRDTSDPKGWPLSPAAGELCWLTDEEKVTWMEGPGGGRRQWEDWEITELHCYH